MSQYLIFLPLAVFFLVLVATTVWTERMRTRSPAAARGFTGEYFLGSRSLSGFVLAMTLIATYGSVSSFVSGPGIAWKLGLGWVVFAAPQIIAGFLVLGLLGKKMAIVSRATGALTVTGLLEVRFGSRLLTVLLSVALLLFFCAMMTGQFIGGAAIFAEAADISPATGLVLFGLLTVGYTAFGGFRAVAWTDTVCAILMLAGMFMLGGAILSEAGGLTAAMERAAAAGLSDPAADLSTSTMLSPNAAGALPWTLLFSAWILVGFGTAGLPQSAVRCMSYRESSDLHRAMIVSTVVCGALMVGLTTIGVLARGLPALDLGGASTDHLVPRLITEYLSPVEAGITLIGPLAATMSTVSSLLIAASSAVVKDLLLTVRPDLEGHNRTLVLVSRGVTLVLGLVSMAFALDPIDLIAWINMGAFGGLELAFLLPLAGGLYWRRATAAGCLASIIGGFAVYAWVLFGKPDIAGFHAIVPAFAAAAVLFVAVSLMTKPTEESRLSWFFPMK
ncbi:sodium/pantothenate symporter [Sutterella sp.]|uniref:sodium/pantothenate symporter n=1 Tax=Sutterella sp. TaxID=1981025 RepID=UPI0026E099AF|nr:sodium/pantothenate symporter [Sutterella sp.]MDO5531324.1 sodium/pantothenate symporter [Sutterella sp.]